MIILCQNFLPIQLVIRLSSFVIRSSSFVPRHSSLVIRHSYLVIRPSSLVIRLSSFVIKKSVHSLTLGRCTPFCAVLLPQNFKSITQ